MANSLRDQMPTVTKWIDELREAFGKDEIDHQIRKGMQGKQTFWARENGITVGSRPKYDNQEMF